MNWYVALARPNAVVQKDHEKLEHETDAEFRAKIAALPPQTVMERLEEVGAGVFYPKTREVRQRLCKSTQAPIRDTVWVSPFGRYVFACHDEPAAIRSVRGVARLINNADGNPGIVSQARMEQMRGLYRNYKRIIRYQEVSLVKGQTVKLIDGPFRSYDAEVDCIKKLCRGLFDAVVEAHGRKLTIKDIPIEDVERV